MKFTVDAINEPSYNPESTDGFDRIASVDTPDPLTAVVHYKEVYAPYALQFVRGTLPKHVLEGRDIDAANDYNRAPLGTGPYRVAEWKSGEYILLERVPSYWRGAEYPQIEQILFRFIANTNTRINQLKSGEVHLVAMFPWDKQREVAAIPGVTVHQHAGQRLRARDAQRAAVAGVPRRARAPRADRTRSIATLIAQRSSTAWRRSTNGPIQPVSWAYEPNVTTLRVRSRHGRARCSTRPAGSEADGDGVREKDGTAARVHADHAGRLRRSRERRRRCCSGSSATSAWTSRCSSSTARAISALWFEGDFDAMLHWWQMPADPELTLFFAADRTPPARPQHQLLRGRLAHDARLRVRSHGRSGEAHAAARRRAAAHRGPGAGAAALQHHQDRRGAGGAAQIQGQSDERGRRSGTCTSGRSAESAQSRPDAALSRPSLAQAIPLLLIVSVLVFALIHAAPGGPLALYLDNPNVRPEDIERLRRALGLDAARGAVPAVARRVRARRLGLQLRRRPSGRRARARARAGDAGARRHVDDRSP